MAEIRAGGHVIGEHGWELADVASVSGYDPGDHNVDEVRGYVGDDKARAEAVLAAERAGKDRTTLVSALEAVLAAEEETEEEPEVEEESNG